MKQAIDDATIDAVTIEAAHPRSNKRVKVSAAGDLVAIKHLLESVAWGHLDICARQCADGIGFANDAGEALFAGSPDLEPDVEPFEGVQFTDAIDNQVVVSEAAFYRLMDRFFGVLIASADEHQLPVRDDSRWPEFLAQAARVRALA